MSTMIKSTILSLALATAVTAHTAAWAPGMYCRGGNDTSVDDQNTNLAVNPLYEHTKEDWWFQHHRGCDAVPPPAGEFLELPANGEFTVELAHNRAFTTLSYDGKQVSDWPDGGDHPDDWDAGLKADGSPECLEDGALHTTNQSTQGATAWAISYESESSKVTMENLVVFSTLDHTPWKRLATYKVPDLKQCPEEGCTCAWLWIPNGCGEGNMYMQGFKCKVTNASPTALPLAAAQVPTYCADDASTCVKGAKQMLAWHQKTGNNVETTDGKTPNYNAKCGWTEGAQTDIFASTGAGGNETSTAVVPSQAAGVSTTAVPATSSESAVQTLSTVVVVKDVSTSSVPSLTSAPAQSALPTGAKPAHTFIGVPWKFRHHRRPRPTAVTAAAAARKV